MKDNKVAQRLISEANHLKCYIGYMNEDLAIQIAKHVCEEVIYAKAGSLDLYKKALRELNEST